VCRKLSLQGSEILIPCSKLRTERELAMEEVKTLANAVCGLGVTV
jgi:hypothetical protein